MKSSTKRRTHFSLFTVHFSLPLACFCACLLGLSPLSAKTQLGADIDGEAASESSRNDVSLSADGGRLAVGILGADGNGTDAGRARVFPIDCPATGSVWYVDAAAAPSGNGSSWDCAFQNLQDAIDAASSGHEIWVKAGTYLPTAYPSGCSGCTTDRDKALHLKSGVKIYGGFDGSENARLERDWVANPTILSGDIGTSGDNSDNAYHVVLSVSDASTTVLDGFTVEKGNANGTGTITVETWPISRQSGGGMANTASLPTIANCTFSNNSANLNGGGMNNVGSAHVTVTNCVFSANSVTLASSNGGAGMANTVSSSPTLTNCTFLGNSSAGYGGGMSNSASNPSLTNCLFSGNTSNQHGGGAMANVASSAPTLTNCTISGNSATVGGGMYNLGSSAPVLTNCIIWNNRLGSTTGSADANLFNSSSTPVITYSLIQNHNPSGTGNLNGITNAADSNYPNFATPLDPATAPSTAGDFHIGACSPVLNLGTNSGAPATDLFGNARPFGTNTDLGVHEFQGAGTSCPAAGTVWFVDAGNTGCQLGTSWSCAFQNLQDAIDAASSGHEIWVKTGTYFPTKDPFGSASPTDPRDKVFYLKNGVAVYGGFDGTETVRAERDWVANPTILSGDLGTLGSNSDNSYHVVLSVSDASTTVLDGFTVEKGNANGTGSISAESKTINQNYGGGMLSHTSNIIVSNCTFSENSSSNSGGGLRCQDNPTVTVNSCIFKGNTTATHGAGLYIAFGVTSAVVTNCLFSGNYATGTGGGLYSDCPTTSLTNCTASGNRCGNANQGGGFALIGSTAILKNCLVWNNRAATVTGSSTANLYLGSTTLNCSYSLIQGLNPSGTGNLDGTTNAATSNYPAFATPLDPTTAPSTAGDFHLTDCSPVLNLGDNTGAPATDLFGNARPFGTNTDLGVHELQSASAAPTIANAGPNQNLSVNSATMAANAPVMGTGQWSLVSGSGTITNAASPSTTVTNLGVGANIFRWTISNAPCSPSTSDVTVTYTTAPVILTCPPTTTVAACQTQTDVNNSFSNWLATASGSGGCNGMFSNNNSGAPSACGGSTTVTFTYTSTCAPLMTSCQTTFSVSATTAPVFSNCTNNTVSLGCNPNTLPSCETIASGGFGGAVTASNSCGSVPVTCTAGEITVSGCNRTQIFTFEATACGQTSTCTRTFTWNATTPPSFNGTCGNGVVNLGCNPVSLPVCDPNVTASNQCGPVTVTCNIGAISVNGCNRQQTLLYVANAPGCGNFSTCQRVFNWQETTAPVFGNCNNTIDLGCNPATLPTCSNAQTAPFGGAVTATNECGNVTGITCAAGSITSNGCDRSQVFTFTVTACGLTSTCTRTFTWQEVTAPVFANCTTGTTDLGCNPATLPGCDPNITASSGCGPASVVCTPGNITQNGCSRAQTFTYVATGGCGLTSTCTRTFTWQEDPVATLTCPDNVTTPAGQTQAAIDAEFDEWLLDASFSGGCDGDLTNNSTGVPPACGGSTTVTFTLTTACRPVQTCQATFTVTAPVNGTIWYVDGTAAPGGTGRSWTCAFQNLQDAINAASSGHEIWVKAGTYKPTKEPDGTTDNSREFTFYLKDGVAVYGGFDGMETMRSERDWVANHTVLSGDIGTVGNNSDNCLHVVLSVSDATTTELNGFTITGGNANTTGSVTVETIGILRSSGGGLTAMSTSLTVTNCIFSGNTTSVNGGALYTGNSPNLTLNGCTFSGNTATQNGAGVYNLVSSPTFSNCAFLGNSATLNGGGVYNSASSNASLTNCVFSGNSSDSYGGGMYNSASSPTLVNCVFSGNKAVSGGGGIRNISSSNSTLKNCIIWNNRVGSETGSAISSIDDNNSTPVITYSLIQNQAPSGTGNLNGIPNAATSNYPQFVTPLDPATAPSTAGDFHLTSCSPVLNLGTNTGAPTTDLFGNARPFATTVDMGVHELQSASAVPTTANAGPDQTLCPTAPATLAANTPSVGAGAWSVVSGPSTSTAQFSSLTNPAATFTPTGGAGAYTLRWTISNSPCTASTDDVVITFNALPTITLGANPSVFPGTTSANLPYTATTDSPDQYSIDYSAAANTAGFVDVTNASLPASPIVLTVPSGAVAATYHATLTVRNSPTTCVSETHPIAVTVAACPTAFTVNDLGDAADAMPGDGACATAGGACTLRAAIEEANALTACSPLTVNFSVTGTINLGSVLPNLNHPNLTVNNGTDPTQLTVRRNAGGNYRIFTIPSGRIVTINGLTIRDGNVGTSGFAGGIYNNNGTLTLNDCVVSNNIAGVSGGGIGHALGTTAINRSTIADNTLVTGTSTIVNGAGMYINHGTVTLNATTFSGNRKNDAFPTSIQGAALVLNDAAVSATNCTFSNNTGRQVIGNIANNQHNLLTLLNCTIGNNTLNSSGVTFGAVETQGLSASATAATIIKNTIVAGNPGNGTAFRTAANGFSTLTSQGNNLCGDATLTPTASGDLTNVNPLLAALGNYGGLTQTHALLPGSPAINTGTAAGAPTSDQRGIARVGSVDIGAFESQGFTLAVNSGNNQATDVNTAFANPLSAMVSSAHGEPVNGGQVTFAPPGSGASATLAGNPATIASGTATSATVTANATAGGPYSVAASATGATATQFSLTNNPVATVGIALASANPACLNSSVSWTATFNLAVAGLTASNFSLVGGTGATITDVTGSGTTWTVTASTGSAAAALGLNMVNSTGVSPTVVGLPNTGSTYTVNGLPTPANAGTNQAGASTCGLTQVALAANAPTVGTGEWSVQSGTGGSFGDANSPTSTFSGNAGATYTLRWTVTNAPCAASTDEMTVTFQQNPAPATAGPDQAGAATCGQTQVTLAATAPTAGTGAWSVQSGTGGSFGDASSPASTFSGTAGNTYTLRWTVTSPPCAPSTDDVTVTFNQAPSFSACPPGVTVSATAGCSATADYTATAVPAANVAYTFGGATTGSGSGSGSGQPFNLGTTAVSLTATNTCGSSSCFFIVVVQAPEISAQGNATTILDGDNTPSASDHTDFGQTNGASVVRTFTVQNTGAAPLNVTAITLAGTDPGQFSVGPLTPASPVPVGQSATFAVTYAPNSAAVHNATVNVANGDCDEATYNFDVRGELTCTAPAFTACPSNLPPVNASEGQCSAAVGYDAAASGLPAPNLTCAFSGATTGSGSGTGSGSNFSAGTTTVTVTATNPCGAPTCTFTVTVLDAHPPSITCPGNISKNTDANQCTAVTNYTSPTFSDNCSGATLTRTSGPASGAAFPKGTTMVEWKATDAAGLFSICQFTVTVADGQDPTVTCPANIVKSADAGQCSALTTFASATATDNCAGVTVAQSDGPASGSAFPKGPTQVRFKATDGIGRTKECAFTVTVNDAQLPTINCPANQTIGTVAGQCYGTTTYTVGYSDNCSGGSAAIQNGVPSGGNFPKGINIVQWKATDAAGLTRTCSFRVTVNDTEAPSIACPASQSLNTDPNLCGAVATYATPTAADNCAPPPTVVKSSGLASGSAFPKGGSAVVWKATDGAGLTKTCSFTVTVTDNQAPGITCPANMAVTGGGSPCVATVNYTTPTGTDNCTVQSVSLMSGLGSGSVFPAGTTTALWRAMDNSGLSATCAFTVTVSCGSGPSQPPRWGGAATSLTTSRSAVPSPPHREGWEGLMLSLSPNPATTEVQILMENLGKMGGVLTVYDVQGRRVWQQMVEGVERVEHVERTSAQQSQHLNTSTLPPGLYFVTLRSEGQVATKRLVVSRL